MIALIIAVLIRVMIQKPDLAVVHDESGKTYEELCSAIGLVPLIVDPLNEHEISDFLANEHLFIAVIAGYRKPSKDNWVITSNGTVALKPHDLQIHHYLCSDQNNDSDSDSSDSHNHNTKSSEIHLHQHFHGLATRENNHRLHSSKTHDTKKTIGINRNVQSTRNSRAIVRQNIPNMSNRNKHNHEDDHSTESTFIFVH